MQTFLQLFLIFLINSLVLPLLGCFLWGGRVRWEVFRGQSEVACRKATNEKNLLFRKGGIREGVYHSVVRPRSRRWPAMSLLPRLSASVSWALAHGDGQRCHFCLVSLPRSRAPSLAATLRNRSIVSPLNNKRTPKGAPICRVISVTLCRWTSLRVSPPR